MAFHNLTKTTVSTEKVMLYADDDYEDTLWVIEVCKALNFFHRIQFVENGRLVLVYLNSNPLLLPSLIILDLNMPVLDGKQTLQKLKSSLAYSSIPVAVFTTSACKWDEKICMQLEAAMFLTKPDTATDWKTNLKKIVALIT